MLYTNVFLSVFIWACVSYEPIYGSVEKGMNDSTRDSQNNELCRVVNGCTTLVKMDVCVPSVKAKMDIKCPDYCNKCGSGYEEDVKKSKGIPQIVKDNMNAMDKQFKDSIKKIADAIKLEEYEKFQLLGMQKLEADSIFSTPTISLDSEDSNAADVNTMVKVVKLKANPISSAASDIVNSESSGLENYLNEFSKKATLENKAARKKLCKQLEADKKKWMGANFFINWAKGAANVVGSVIPVVGSAIASGVNMYIDQAVDIAKALSPPKSETDIQLHFIEKKIEDLTNMTIAIGIKLEKNLNKLHKEMAMFFDMTAKQLDKIYIELSSEIGKIHMDSTRHRYMDAYRMPLNNLLVAFQDFTNLGDNNKTRERMLTTCKQLSILALVKTMAETFDKDTLNLQTTSSNGDIMMIKKSFGEYHTDLRRFKMLAPVCAVIQEFSYEATCNRMYEISEHSTRLQNILSSEIINYYKHPEISSAIQNAVKNILANLDVKNDTDTQTAVDLLINELNKKFSFLTFFVLGERKSAYITTDIWESQEDKGSFTTLTMSKSGIAFTVIWHSVDYEPTGDIWEKCYEGNLTSTDKNVWFVNRPRCVRVGLTVKKKTVECPSLCRIQEGDKIPSCKPHTGSMKVYCFKQPEYSDIIDPSQYLNAVTNLNPEKKIIREKYLTNLLFVSKNMGERTKKELEGFSKEYCIQAVVSQHSRDNANKFYYATTMTGATFPYAYYVDKLLPYYTDQQMKKYKNKVSEYKEQKEKLNYMDDDDCLRKRFINHFFETYNYAYDETTMKGDINQGNFLFMERVMESIKGWGPKECSVNVGDLYFYYTKQMLIFKKCQKEHTELPLPNKNFKQECITKLNKKTNLVQKLKVEVQKFENKIEKDKKNVEASNKKKKMKPVWIGLGVGIGIGLVALVIVIAGITMISRKRKQKRSNAVRKGSDEVANNEKLRRPSSKMLSRASVGKVRSSISNRRSSNKQGKGSIVSVGKIANKTPSKQLSLSKAGKTSSQNVQKKSSRKAELSRTGSRLQSKGSKVSVGKIASKTTSKQLSAKKPGKISSKILDRRSSKQAKK